MGRKEENKIGLVGATAYIVGSIIGSGIFIAPKGIVRHAGSVGLSLVIWIVCALLNMMTAINYIELGTSIPENGADLAYVSYMGWTPLAFSFLWLAVVIQGSSSCAVLSITFGQYIVEAISSFVCLSDWSIHYAQLFFGFGLLMILTLTNMFSLQKFASKVQIVSMFSKIFATAVIIAVGFFFIIFKGRTAHFSPTSIMSGSNWSPTQIVLAIYQGNWAFGGYTTLNYGTEEIQIKNFRKTLPRAVLGGLTVATVIYLLVNISYFSILTPDEIIASDAVASTFIDETLGKTASLFVPPIVGLLLVGTMNGDIFGWSRYMVAGAKRGMMPTAFGLLHVDNDSPRVSVAVHTFLSILFCFLGDTDRLVDYLTITSMMSSICSLLALAIIKWKCLPVAADAVKYPLFWPLINIVINVALLAIPIAEEPVTSAIGFGFFVAGIAAYYAHYGVKKYTSFLSRIDDGFTFVCQVLSWSVVDTTPLLDTKNTRQVTKM